MAGAVAEQAVVSMDQAELSSRRAASSPEPREEFAAKVDFAIDRARRALLAQQHPEGYWQAPLEANAEMNAEYLMFNRFMELPPDPDLDKRLSRTILETQQGDGSWALFPGGEGDLSTTVTAYFGLKLVGMRAGDEPMMQARRWILARGGIANAGTLARFYLAAMNQVPWRATTSMPVELTLLPNWFPINIYELSSWARGTLMALMVLQAKKPATTIDWRQGVLELYIQPPHFTKFTTPGEARMVSLRNLLRGTDKLLRWYDDHHVRSLRARALRHAENWLLEHQDANGSWGGIQPCYILTPMALKGLGYRNDHPVIVKALEAVRELIWEQGDSIIYQPCISPNWDTALAAKALLETGLPGDHQALRDAARWLIEHQIFKKGDWSIKRPKLEPGGWAFEFFNDWYPDVDDSAVILMVLAATAHDDTSARDQAIRLGANWVMGMQSKDGGFAAFDVDNDSEWLNSAPFADLEAATDPTCADLTGRVLEMMGAVGYRADHPVARRAISWLKRKQDSDGSWWGRWGVAYIYGTFSALAGLRAIGVDRGEPWIKRAVEWLKSVQNSDGGWGETCLADKDPELKGKGTSTPSQTAWALIGLLAGEDSLSDSAMRGVAWLAERQNDDGRWEDIEFTGTGFPNHFYLRYHMYAHYFPLMALGRFRRRLLERAAG
jgi:squalene-hopene/tetraprenyl-beta-curcumene cyclase